MDFLGIRSGVRNHKKNEFEEKLRSGGLKEDAIEYFIDNYFPIYNYKYKLTYNTLSLTDSEYETLNAQVYKKVKNN
jgi:hypothetical protein